MQTDSGLMVGKQEVISVPSGLLVICSLNC